MKNLLISDAQRVQHQNENYGRPFPEYRGSGHTTAQALGALAVAIANPGKPQVISDHFGTRQSDEYQGRQIERIAKDLGLQYIEVGYRGKHLTVTSNHVIKG